jgi:hypothetical protein
MTRDPMDLPRAAAWKASFGGRLGLTDYLAQEGGATLALAFAALFWPAFVEVRGCVLLAERYDERGFEGWWTQLEGRRREIEATVNHLHIWDLFAPDDEDLPPGALGDLTKVLAGTWACALGAEFPQRRFDITVTDEPDDYGPTVTFCTAESR